MNDNEIIGKTRIEPSEGYVSMVIEMPVGDPFVQRAQDAESAKKHIMQWCEAVRNELTARQERIKDEQAAAKARRKSGVVTEAPAEQPQKVDGDPKVAVLMWYDNIQTRIDELGTLIKESTAERDRLRNERDELGPVVAKWRGSE